MEKGKEPATEIDGKRWVNWLTMTGGVPVADEGFCVWLLWLYWTGSSPFNKIASLDIAAVTWLRVGGGRSLEGDAKPVFSWGSLKNLCFFFAIWLSQ